MIQINKLNCEWLIESIIIVFELGISRSIGGINEMVFNPA
jgi:hypothetical protein